MKVSTRVAYSIFPSYVWSALISESKFTRCRWSSALFPARRRLLNRLQRLNGLRIHLGCGARIVSGWINVDGTSGEGVDLQWDLRYGLPFSDGSAQMIYSEHVLEH